MKKTAVVLFNLGAPDDLKSVHKFLFNLFSDPAIIALPAPLRYLLALIISALRAKTSKKIYEILGGKSPLLEITNRQAESLERALSFRSNYKVFVAMRYWHPFSYETIEKIKLYQPDEIILLPLYPQFSTATTGSSFIDFMRQIIKQKINIPIKKIYHYSYDDKFIFSHLRLIKQTIARAESLGYKNNYRLLFCAHGLPQKMIDDGDVYVAQIKISTKSIIIKLKIDLQEIDYRICYQGKVGFKEWTKPSLELEVKRAALDKKAIIIVPISFVSDHSETLFELDIKYKNLAYNLGAPLYLRVPALNDDGYFIDALANLCGQ